MYTKENLLVAKMASKSKIKPELACIAYYGDKTVATDSFRLLEIPVPDIDGESPTHLPTPELREATSAKMPKGFILVDDPLGYEITEAKPESYPDYEQIMPKTHNDPEEYTTVKLNGKLLGETLIQMAKLNAHGAVTMKVPTTPYKGVYLEAEYKGKTARGIVMPHNR